MFADYKKIINRNFSVILIGTFVTVLSYSMMIPYFAIHLKENLLFSATAIATIMTVYRGLRRIMVLFGGYFADKYGIKLILLLGLIIHSIAYLLYAFANTYSIILALAVLTTIGGSFTIPTIRIMTAESTDDDELKPKAFALRSLVYSVAFALGPAIGIVVIQYSFKWLFIACSISYALYSIAVLIFVDSISNKKKAHDVSVIKNIKLLLKNKRILNLFWAAFVFYFLMAQFESTVPIGLKSIVGISNNQIGILFTIMAVVSIAMQQIVVHFTAKKRDELSILFAIALAIVSLLLLYFIPNFYGAIVVFVLITFSELICMPILYSAVIKHAPENAKASFSGTSAFIEGLGIASGTTMGGLLIDMNLQLNVWLFIGGIATIFALVYLYNIRDILRYKSKSKETLEKIHT
ncbi:MFS transporter [Paramaledivibacter caminithermalis]|jgi:MFS family permease|uniref:Predicted arabinose efflux permease, MFS family n=1 Tax=Paramaledivibacter caminithermalis (strain DSM 15212 / CIP 107654 / DViRD3) TaxID=1121301 RepID=A0A1M6SPH3_PARC5|nr:MFS transporter [Paramaledivibacter caminithermalis]SHK46654.1 Predicted arabinose efflux permease, MFS family [Paramaledivibacter caminithermalis DSM 15212]